MRSWFMWIGAPCKRFSCKWDHVNETHEKESSCVPRWRQVENLCQLYPMKCFRRFLGLSQSVPVTSYIKMVDIWMLFTMTIPFLEVVYHTSNEMFKQSDVIRVKPHNLSLEEVLPSNNTKAVLWMMTKRFVLPISSLLFTIIFWIVGLIASFYSGGTKDSNMSDCLMIDLNWWKNNFLVNGDLIQCLFVKWCFGSIYVFD